MARIHSAWFLKKHRQDDRGPDKATDYKAARKCVCVEGISESLQKLHTNYNVV